MTYSLHPSTPSFEEFAKHANDVWDYYKRIILGQQIGRLDGNPNEFDVVLNDYFLAASIEHARIELSRWADYHLASKKTSRPNNHKLAGFLARWVAKVRPIQVVPKPSTSTDIEMPEIPALFYKINASYAATLLRSYLVCDIVDLALVEDLVYKLHYRDETALNLSLIAAYMERTGSKYDHDIQFPAPKWGASGSVQDELAV